MPNIKLSSLNKGLVGHWTMSQDSLKGSLLADKTPYENDGTIYGATFATDRMGQPNKCMYFDGVDDYINCGNDSSLNIRNEITLGAWINVSAYPSNRGRIIFKYSPGSYDLEISSSGQIYSASLYEKIGWKRVYSTTTVDLGKWYYINFVFNGKQGMIYFNGLRNSPIVSIVGKLSSSSAPTRIGATFESGIPAQLFNGLIDDVRIYNRALSEEEITLLYNSYNPKIVMKTSLPKIKLYGGDY